MSNRARGQTWNTVAPFSQNLLSFPNASDTGYNASKYATLQHLDPHLHGLPIWGPGNAGITVLMERMTRIQAGFCGSLWWANGGAFNYVGGNAITGGGSSDSYWGMPLFPQPADWSSTDSVWEVSGMAAGTDNTLNLNGVVIPATHNVKLIQGMRISRDPATQYKICLGYVNLPNVSNAYVIQGPEPGNEFRSFSFGETNPPIPSLHIGDSLWSDTGYPKECFSGPLGRIKIIGKILTVSDFQAEMADFSRLVTADAIANIWFMKTNWRGVDDLTCDAGTGHSLNWFDSTYKASLVSAASVLGWN